MDREQILAAAAEAYAFKKMLVSHTDALELIRSLADAFSEAQWAQMQQLHLLPVAWERKLPSKENLLIFATHDPARPEVHRLLQGFELRRLDLRYAPAPVLAALLAAAFPPHNKYLACLTEAPAFDAE